MTTTEPLTQQQELESLIWYSGSAEHAAKEVLAWIQERYNPKPADDAR